MKDKKGNQKIAYISITLALLILLASIGILREGSIQGFATATMNSNDGPQIHSSSVNPFKIHPKETLTISVVVSDSEGISEVFAEISHDKGTDRAVLHFAEGNETGGT